MSILQQFTYQETPVRTINRDGQPWFVATDVTGVLGLANSRTSLALLEDDEKGVHSVDTPGGVQQVSVINEPGLYSLILRSRKPEAKQFKRWVTHEVIPSIRKTGEYQVEHLDIPKTLPEALRAYAAEVEDHQHTKAELDAAKPSVAYVERYVSEDDVVTVKAFAAQCGMTEPKLRDLFIDRKVAYRKSIGSRWSQTKQAVVPVYEWAPYGPFIPYFDNRPQHNAPRHHNGQLRHTLYIRQARALDLADKLNLNIQQELVEAISA